MRVVLLSPMCLRLIILAGVLISSLFSQAWAVDIAVVSPPSIMQQTPAKLAVGDAVRLLQQAFPAGHVTRGGAGDVRLELRLTRNKQSSAKTPSFPVLAYPSHNYRWTSRREGKTILLRLESPSPEGLSFGIYALLQEKLGFRFLHPRQTVIPRHSRWPLPDKFIFAGEPIFDKKGFHLHTLHPIEMTGPIFDPSAASAAEVREYIDWLVRNGQNVFQFCLLRGVDRERWIPHAREVIAYAHSRGVLVCVQFSLSMLQQQSFQAVKLLRPGYRRQVDRTLAWLFGAPWDYVAVDFTMGEHLPDLAEELPELSAYLVRKVTRDYRKSCLVTTHVIRRPGDEQLSRVEPWGRAGILLHTVMCYGVCDEEAPVYGNRNLRFILERGEREAAVRETWYWPESSYWVSFDNSIPLLLLPYLEARLRDIPAVAAAGIRNHITFTSGWEWGYWLVDWSIARWSWHYRWNGMAKRETATSAIEDLFPAATAQMWREALELQQRYLKEKNLLPLMSASTPFAELPGRVAKPFQPEPPFSFQGLRSNKLTPDEYREAGKSIKLLDEFALKMESLVREIDARLVAAQTSPEQRLLGGELSRGLRVTALRAQHRAATLRALLAVGTGDSKTRVEMLERASNSRLQAAILVGMQEKLYRYPVERLARKNRNLSSYGFGYLFPASNLHFWLREEEQVRTGRFDPFFMNIWDFRRTLGLGSLVF